MAFSLSPGITVREFDLSLYAQQLSATILGLVGIFTKGPVNERTLITNESDLVDVFGRPTTNAYGFYAAREYLRQANQLWIVRVGTSALAKGSAEFVDSLATPSLKFEALTYGTHADFIKVTISTAASGVRVDVIEITPQGAEVNIETFTGVTRANAESLINGVSALVTVSVLTAGTPGEPDIGQESTLAGGNDGITGSAGELNSAVIGTQSGSTTTGLQLYRDVDEVDITLLSAPGFTDGVIINEVINICETRHDALGIVDTPPFLTPEQAVLFHNGQGPWVGLHAAFNSSFGAMYYDWLEVNDEFNQQRVFVPPSCFAVATIARTDRVAEPWFAPAGYRRGIASTALSVGTSPKKGQRELMYGGGNAINFFVNDVRSGIVLLGQRTLQRTASALDRVNVRRMLLLIEKVVAVSSKPFLMQPNTRRTWREWRGVIEPVFQDVLSKEGLSDFLVLMDESTISSLDLDQSRMVGRIFIKPVKAAETIVIDFVITSQGADFQELLLAA